MKNIKNNFTFLISCAIMLAACDRSNRNKAATSTFQNIKDTAGKKVQRYASVTGLKPEKIARYKELHAAVWPEVLKQIKASNIQNYSIYLKEIDKKYYLFSYFEYTGKNFDADMKKMAADSTTQRWWKETDPTQIPLLDAAAKNEIWSKMEEVFHQD